MICVLLTIGVTLFVPRSCENSMDTTEKESYHLISIAISSPRNHSFYFFIAADSLVIESTDVLGFDERPAIQSVRCIEQSVELRAMKNRASGSLCCETNFNKDAMV